MNYGAREHWEELYSRPPEHGSNAGAALVESMLAAAERLHGSLQGANALDVACGTGVLSSALSRRGARVVALDRSLGALTLARRGTPPADPWTCDGLRAGSAAATASRPLWTQCDVLAAPLAERAFDLALCLRSVWIIPDLPSVFRGIARALRPGGWLLIQTWDAPQDNLLLALGCAVLGHHLPQLRVPAEHAGPSDHGPGSLIPLLRAAGFTEVETKECGGHYAVPTVERYWLEFSDIASTASFERSRQSLAVKHTIDEHLVAAMRRRGWSAETPTLPMRWHVVCSRAPAVSRRPPGMS